ncbi:MAG: hypothetical protein M3P06_18165 [Acidobacteriota bacterium]|nr:hypothetical protein [Acidobacteriota bacterium]
MSIDQEVAILEGRQIALRILADLREDHGVDLLPIFDDPSLSTQQKLHRAYTLLLGAVCARGGFGEPPNLPEGDVTIEPNIILTEEQMMEVRNLTGQAVFHYLSNLTERFKAMSKASGPESLARMIAEAGFASVSISMARETFAAIRGGQALTAALRTGITRIGMSTAIGAVVLVLAVLVYWFASLNPKRILGMIINDTDSPLVVNNWRAGVHSPDRGGDLYMERGKMESYMQDYQGGDLSKQVQIDARVWIEEERFCPAGLFFADKDFGVYGAEGVMVLSATDRMFELAHMFAVPYNKDNGTNVAFVYRPDVKRLFEELYSRRSVRATAETHGYFAFSTINHHRGGEVGCIAYVAKARREA